MTIDVKQYFSANDITEEFAYALPILDAQLNGVNPFRYPVQVMATLQGSVTGVDLLLEMSYTLFVPCDRCNEDAEILQKLVCSHKLVRNLTGEEDENLYILVEEDRLDLDALVYADIFLNLPAKLLCREACKGLCPKCGINLNVDICSCEHQERDPRLDVLKQFLTDEE